MRRIQRDQRETQSIVTTNSLSNFLISQSRKNLLAISFFYGLTRPSIDFLSRPGSSIQQRRGSDRKAAAPPIDSLSHQITIVDIFYFLGRLYKPERGEKSIFSPARVCLLARLSERGDVLWAGMKVYLRTGGSGALSRQ
jgi:hypothetical protein